MRNNPLMAIAPRYKMEVRFTNTYKNNQNIAMIKDTVSLYRVFKNCGIVKMRFFKIHRHKPYRHYYHASAAIHSYAETATPTKKPLPLMPINCSAEILDAINEAPIAHHVSEPSAKKNAFESCSARLRFYKPINHKLQQLQNK